MADGKSKRQILSLVSGGWPGNSSGEGHNGGNEPPGGGGMDGRIRDLERDVVDIKVALGKVEVRLETIENTMLTKGQMAVYMLMAAIAVFGGGWWVVQQYLAPILAALPAA